MSLGRIVENDLVCPQCGGTDWMEESEENLPYWEEENGFEPTLVYICQGCDYIYD